MDLHPVEVAYLNKGTDLAILTACVGLWEQDILHCSSTGGVTVEPGAPVDGHPVETAVVSALAAGLSTTSFWIRLRSGHAVFKMQQQLLDQGLLRDRSGLGVLWPVRHTRAGGRLLAAARARARSAAERVATRGAREVDDVSPLLLPALGPAEITPARRAPKARRASSSSRRAQSTSRPNRRDRNARGAFIYGHGCGDGGSSSDSGGSSCGGDSGCGGGGSCGGGSCGGGGCGGGGD